MSEIFRSRSARKIAWDIFWLQNWNRMCVCVRTHFAIFEIAFYIGADSKNEIILWHFHLIDDDEWCHVDSVSWTFCRVSVSIYTISFTLTINTVPFIIIHFFVIIWNWKLFVYSRREFSICRRNAITFHIFRFHLMTDRRTERKRDRNGILFTIYSLACAAVAASTVTVAVAVCQM